MFVENKLNPPGCNPIGDSGRKPVLKVVSGDSWEVRAMIFAENGGPATPENSHVEFVIAENQFSPPIWTGEWFSGVVPYDNRPGYIRVVVPREITRAIRRGSYMFSLRVSNRVGSSYSTQLAGNFLVEYMPTSDQHSIPYRDGTSEIFSSSAPEVKPQQDTATTSGIYLKDEDGMYHEIKLVREIESNGLVLAVEQHGVVKP